MSWRGRYWRSRPRSFQVRERRTRSYMPFVPIRCFISIGTFEILESRSKELGVPVSRLMAIAVDKELESRDTFSYPCLAPVSSEKAEASSDDAHRILEYLLNFPQGTGRDSLVLSRRNVGISDRARFLRAYHQLLSKDRIQEGRPSRFVKYDYPPNYVWVRLTEVGGMPDRAFDDPEGSPGSRWK